jgi:pimeloyl-ACP methyl ester carboxylesterase
MTDVAYRTADVDGLTVFYREAGLIPLLADRFHVVAPDLPGFGKSDMPPRGDFEYTFEHLTDVIDRWTQAPGLDRFALYVFDFVPTGHFALETHAGQIATAIRDFLGA